MKKVIILMLLACVPAVAQTTITAGRYGKLRDAGQFANVQTAVTDAGTTGAVMIPHSGANGNFTNPNNIPIIDFRLGAGTWRTTCSARDFGAVGDGVTDDGPAINTAFVSCAHVTLPYSASGYKCITTCAVPAGSTLDCRGGTIFHSSNATTLISLAGADDATISNCILQGSNGGTVAGVQTTEILLSVTGGHRWKGENLTLKNSDGWSIKRDVGTDSAPAVHGDRGQLVNIVAKNSFTALHVLAGTSAEYLDISNFDAVSNTNGLIIAAGNITISNSNITDNVTGVWLTSGANHGHGIISNSNINHNTGDNIFADTVINGFTFIGNHIYANSSTTGFIHLNASHGIEFIGNFIDSNIKNDAADGSNNHFLNNYMVSGVATLAPAGTSGTTNLVLSGNTIPTGFGWSGFNNGFNVANGVISAGTPLAAGAAIGDVTASRDATNGCLWLGSDTNKYFCRLGNAFTFGGGTSLVPATDGLSSLGDSTHHFNGLFISTCANAGGTCGSSSIGSFGLAATATTQTITTTKVTANSTISVTRDNSLGTRLGLTCNTQSSLVLGTPYVSARTAGVSFVVTIDVAPSTNPLCLNFEIVN